MQIINEQTELVDVRNLKPHPKNANVGNADLIAESISTNGFYGQIIAQRSTGHILVGHHRLQAAQQLGAKEVPVTWVDVDDTRALKIMLADNQTAALAHRDEEALASLLSELKLTDDLTGTGYADADLDSLIASIAANEPTPEPVEAPEPQVDRAEELRAKWGTERGQLWLIPSKTVPGKSHRLLCGDSTNAEDVARLMDGQKADMVWSDPPYGIKISAGGKVGGAAPTHFAGKVGKVVEASNFVPIANDETTDTAVSSARLLLDLHPKAVHIWWGGNYYADALPASSCWIVWDKENSGNFADAELAWTNHESPVRIFKHMWNGMVKASEHGQKRVHPTQKPVALAVWAFEKYGEKGDLILDPFLGSGMSIVGAEQTGRTCSGIEYMPHYCAVILERLSGMGLTPELQ